jgi:hypothetical protein
MQKITEVSISICTSGTFASPKRIYVRSKAEAYVRHSLSLNQVNLLRRMSQWVLRPRLTSSTSMFKSSVIRHLLPLGDRKVTGVPFRLQFCNPLRLFQNLECW